jgi:hypothetical protein
VNGADIPRIYTAIAEWTACMIYALTLKRRFKGAKSAAAAALFLSAFIGLQIGAGELPVSLWIPGMVAAVLLMYFCIFALCGVKPLETVFWTARAFVLAEFAASLEWQFYYYVAETVAGGDRAAVGIPVLAVFYSAVFTGTYFLERRYKAGNLDLGVSYRDAVAAAGIAVAVFAISNISFISRDTPISGQYAGEIFYIRTLVDLCGILLFYAHQEQRLWMRAKFELNAMGGALERQYGQYVYFKDNIESLNRKMHDFKNQIAAIEAEGDGVKKAGYIEEVKKGIRYYEAQYDTGSKVLDTILTGKSMYCAGHGITFTCVADGALLRFINVMDICSIFGNALDNAIESVEPLADPEKKLIKTAVYAQNNLLAIRFENGIEETPRFKDGLPVTTKNDRENHGYGVKSIKAAAEKYGGSMKISADNQWFALYLLIPMGGEAERRGRPRS